MRTVALANQKGGVGKTTTALHLAHGLALAGRRVALLDLDPQGNATLGLQGMASEAEDEPFGDEGNSLSALQRLGPGLWILPSPGAHRNIAPSTVPDARKLQGLVDALAADGLDWLVVDCPPRMDAWGWAGLALCEEVVLPVQSEFFAMHGLSQMLQTLAEARRRHPSRGRLLGVLATLVDLAEPITVEVLDNLRDHLGSQMFQSLIYRDLTFVEAASHGRTLFDYRLDAKGALAYAEFVREVLHG